ncbi:unnamed protein product [Urochloa humidicola]
MHGTHMSSSTLSAVAGALHHRMARRRQSSHRPAGAGPPRRPPAVGLLAAHGSAVPEALRRAPDHPRQNSRRGAGDGDELAVDVEERAPSVGWRRARRAWRRGRQWRDAGPAELARRSPLLPASGTAGVEEGAPAAGCRVGGARAPLTPPHSLLRPSGARGLRGAGRAPHLARRFEEATGIQGGGAVELARAASLSRRRSSRASRGALPTCRAVFSLLSHRSGAPALPQTLQHEALAGGLFFSTATQL